MKAEVTILVQRNEGVLDPQSSAITHSAQTIGFFSLEKLSLGRTYITQWNGTTLEEIQTLAKDFAEKVLCNPVIEKFTIQESKIIEV